MRFSNDFLDELRMRLPLADVIGRKVKLVRKGRELSGLCPFHNEKTPSFTVAEDKGFYHCFGCGAHGDVIKFVMNTEGLVFPEAVERLAHQAGLQLPDFSPEDQEKAETRKNLYEVMATAAGWFQSQLKTSSGEAARAYAEGRGLDHQILEDFGIGFAPASRTALKEALSARKITESQMCDAGLLIKPEDGSPSYDRFRNRIMFPILDSHGRVIAFGGRAMDSSPAKYLNSPETPLFHKGRVLYHYLGARKAAFDSGQVIAVEGYMDVIALVMAGIREAVAPLGTALTEQQIALLWRLAPEPILCFDGDKAGVKAAHRAIERVLPDLRPGFSLRFALLPDGHDPDSLIAEGGRDAFDAVLASAKSLSEMLWLSLTESADISTPERRAGLEKKIFDTLRPVKDAKVLSFYQSEFGRRLKELFRGSPRKAAGRFNRDKNQFGRDKGRPLPSRPRPSGLLKTRLGRAKGSAPVVQHIEEILILTILNHPDLLNRHFEDFSVIGFSSAELDKVRSAIIGTFSGKEGLDRETLKTHLITNGFGAFYDRLMAQDTYRIVWSAWPDADITDAESGWIHTLNRLHHIQSLERERKKAEDALAEDFTDEGLSRLKAIQQAIQAAAGNEADVDGYGLSSEHRQLY